MLRAYHIIRPSDRGAWKVQTAAYQYALDDADGREIFAYHWHPHIENVRYPHLHISRGAARRTIVDTRLALAQNVLIPELAMAHFPTRRISLEDTPRLIIEQFGVEPMHPDWDVVLQRSRESFKTHRTWT